MSLYICADLISDQLDKLSLGNLTLVQSFVHFFSNSAKEEYRKSCTADQEFLNKLGKKIDQRTTTDNYEDLSEDSKFIEDYLASNKTTLIKDCLTWVLNDLKAMDNSITKTRKDSVEEQSVLTSHDYQKFQTPEYLVAEINQGKLQKMGKSPGECYGFTYAMVNPKLSPYKNPGVTIDLNKEVHNYQKFQMERDKDQKSIKRTRLTREHFCPDPQKQAQQILDIATEHKGRELQLTRRGSVGGHACYISVQDDGKIRYMDPNHGAYLFQSSKDFIDFYGVASKKEKELGVDFRFYSVSELKYDEKETLAESKTWQGTIRSFLTGSKYGDNHSLSNKITSGINIGLGIGVGAGVGAAIGAAVGSVVPIIGTGIGAIVGAGLGGAIGAGSGKLLSSMANRRGHEGILGIPHLIQDTWHSFKENPLSFLSPFSSKTNAPAAVATNGRTFSSTSKILSHFHINSSPKKLVVTQEVTSAEKNTDKVEELLKAATFASSLNKPHLSLKPSGADNEDWKKTLVDYKKLYPDKPVQNDTLSFETKEDAINFFTAQATGEPPRKFLASGGDQEGKLNGFNVFSCGNKKLYQGSLQDIQNQLKADLNQKPEDLNIKQGLDKITRLINPNSVSQAVLHQAKAHTGVEEQQIESTLPNPFCTRPQSPQ